MQYRLVPALTLLAAGAVSAPLSAPLSAQEALRYDLRRGSGAAVQALSPGADEQAETPDLSGVDAVRVLQGPRVTLVGPAGDEALKWESADVRLLEGAPLESPRAMGLRDLVYARGWPVPRGELGYETLEVEVQPGDRDREIAGRPAEHHVLKAELLRTHEGGRDQHFVITADLWTIEDLPFSWAPFGTHGSSLPGYDPELREAMEAELKPLGLPAAGVTTIDFEMLGPDDTPGDPQNAGSVERRAFEIASLSTAEPFSGPDPAVVDADWIAELQGAMTADPAGFCGQVSAGEVPEVVREGAPERVHAEIVRRNAAACDEQIAGIYLSLLGPLVREDREAFCESVAAAETPDAVAAAVLTDVQARGFAEMLSGEEKERFASRVSRVCGR